MKWIGIGLIGILLVLSGCTQIQGGNSTGEAIGLPAGQLVAQPACQLVMFDQSNPMSPDSFCKAKGYKTGGGAIARNSVDYYDSTNGTCSGKIQSRTMQTIPYDPNVSIESTPLNCTRGTGSGLAEPYFGDVLVAGQVHTLCCK